MTTTIHEGADLRLEPEQGVRLLDWGDVFGRTGRVEVEIGIGKGRFLLAAAEARPDVLHLGVEWSNEYLRIAQRRAARRGLTNVRFIRIDAAHLVAKAIPDDSVDAYFVFYPDPWPKKRHQKRRFLQRKNAVHLIRTLKLGGCLHVATDHDEYWNWIEEAFTPLADFEPLPAFGGPEFPLPIDEPLTNFEAKYAVEGRSRHRRSWRLTGKTEAVVRVDLPEARV